MRRRVTWEEAKPVVDMLNKLMKNGGTEEEQALVASIETEFINRQHGTTFNGANVTMAEAKVDIYGNQNVIMSGSGKGQPGRTAESCDIDSMMLCPEEIRNNVLEILRQAIRGRKGKDTVLTFKAAIALKWISAVPPFAVAVSYFGCKSGESTYNDYRNGTLVIHEKEIDTRKKELQNALNNRQ